MPDSDDDFGGSLMIDLRIHTSDPRRRDLIRRYWKLGRSGSDFVEPFDAPKRDFGLSRGGIVGIVRSDSTALSSAHRCTECGKPKEFDCWNDLRDNPKQKPFTCEDCASVVAKQAGTAKRQAPVEGPEKEGALGSEGVSKGKEIHRGEEGRMTASEVGVDAEGNVGTEADSEGEAGTETLGRPLRAAAWELAEASRHLRAPPGGQTAWVRSSLVDQTDADRKCTGKLNVFPVTVKAKEKPGRKAGRLNQNTTDLVWRPEQACLALEPDNMRPPLPGHGKAD